MDVEEHVVWSVGCSEGLVVVVYEYFLGSFVRWHDVGCDLRSVDYSADDFVRLETKGVTKSGEVLRAVDWEIAKQKCVMLSKLLGQCVVTLQQFNGGDCIVQTRFRSTIVRSTKRER